MATFNFPQLRFKSDDIRDLLKDKDTKNFVRICMQFFRRSDGRHTLVAQVLRKRRRRIEKKLFFIEAIGKTENNISFEKDELIYLQHELSRKQVIELSKNGTEDLIFTPQKINVNPDGVTFTVNGQSANPCPPADPPTN